MKRGQQLPLPAIELLTVREWIKLRLREQRRATRVQRAREWAKRAEGTR
jgi:hypothetical protein